MQAWVVISLSFQILCDSLITASMIYYLWRARSTLESKYVESLSF